MKPAEENAWALEKAAQVWCQPATANKTMDVTLALAFAEVLVAERERSNRIIKALETIVTKKRRK